MRRPPLLRADLHLHTRHSPDSPTSYEDLIQACINRNINCIAVTDHNAIEGSIQMSKLAPFKVIPAEEIKTTQGEIIGFFINERIPKGLSPEETAKAIKAQGGLVCIPHPFDRVRRSHLKLDALVEILPYVDIIEAFNARTTFLRDSERAVAFAREHHLPVSAGSDAHVVAEIGATYVEMPEFDGPDSFLDSLRRGSIVAARSPFWVHFASSWSKTRNRILGKKKPGS